AAPAWAPATRLAGPPWWPSCWTSAAACPAPAPTRSAEGVIGGRLVFRVHAVRRMAQREISVEDVREILRTGTVIENYPHAVPEPTRAGVERVAADSRGGDGQPGWPGEDRRHRVRTGPGALAAGVQEAQVAMQSGDCTQGTAAPGRAT